MTSHLSILSGYYSEIPQDLNDSSFDSHLSHPHSYAVPWSSTKWHEHALTSLWSSFFWKPNQALNIVHKYITNNEKFKKKSGFFWR